MDAGTRHLLLLFFITIVVATRSSQSQAAIFNISNRCPFTLWPGIIPPVNGSGMRLDPGNDVLLRVPEGTDVGRVWMRTGCSFDTPGNKSCQTGDCDGDRVCTTGPTSPPVNSADFNLNAFPDNDSHEFNLNIIDGFNVPMAFLPVPVPSMGSSGCSKGPRCVANIASQCPQKLKVPGGCLGECHKCDVGVNINTTTFYARMCPDVLHNFYCPIGTNYQIILCPPENLVSLSSPPPPPPPNENGSTSSSKSKKRTIFGLILAASIGGFLFLASLVLFFILHRQRMQRHQDMQQEHEEERLQEMQQLEDEAEIGRLPGMPRRFSFQELQEATFDFRDKIGNGGFGSVFKGRFGGEAIAVKKLDRVGQGKKEFLAEVRTIGTVHHVNVVRVIGFCAEKAHRLLVYEFMPKGSLDNWIFCRQGHDNRSLMDWQTRFYIISNVAKGLCYLHEECIKKIAHLDLKPQNILLDDNFNAKVSDFGMCKFIDRDISHVVTRMRGTPGYLSPEWLTTQITEKADVYSFGVVVLEIVCGRKNLDPSRSENSVHLVTLLEEKVKNDNLEELIDSNLSQAHTEAIEMMKLAMWCLQVDSKKRPNMSDVVKVLEGLISCKTDLDRNFVVMDLPTFGSPGTAGMSSGAPGTAGMSAPPQASELSGPR